MTPSWPRLTLVIPCGRADATHLGRLLRSLAQQTYPKASLEIFCITAGNSEEAKALGIAQVTGEIVGMLCTDNVLREPDFLTTLVDAARQPGVVGAYTARYAYVPHDTALSRYFALLGANDPLCWWLGKADRNGYFQNRTQTDATRFVTYQSKTRLPSLGDNGFFLKARLAKSTLTLPDRFGSCMDMCERLRTYGHATYAIVPTHALWHRSGEDVWVYLKKRFHYATTLYFQKRSTRRWHLVATPRDWALSLLFALCSLLVVPQMCVSFAGIRRIRDRAWLYHPLICFSLTLAYTWATLMWLWSSVRSTVRRNFRRACGA